MAQMHLPEHVQALLDVVRGEHRVRILNHVRSEVQLLVLCILADLLNGVRKLQVLALVVSSEVSPGQCVLLLGLWEMVVVEVASVVDVRLSSLKPASVPSTVLLDRVVDFDQAFIEAVAFVDDMGVDSLLSDFFDFDLGAAGLRSSFVA